MSFVTSGKFDLDFSHIIFILTYLKIICNSLVLPLVFYILCRPYHDLTVLGPLVDSETWDFTFLFISKVISRKSHCIPHGQGLNQQP